MRENYYCGPGDSRRIVIFAGLSRFKLLLVTGITSYGLVGLKAIAFVMLCLFLMILHPIGLIPGLGSGDRPESSGIGPRLPLGKGSTWLVMLGPVDVFRSFSIDPNAIS